MILFNAKRGGEPPRLFLLELDEANESAWISSEQLEALDDIDRKLVENTKITYQSGKGNYSIIICSVVYVRYTGYMLKMNTPWIVGYAKLS